MRVIFSKIGGMVELERTYDFHELVNCVEHVEPSVKHRV